MMLRADPRCALVVPLSRRTDPALDLADEAVYESKHGGRNRVSARVG